MNERRRLAFAGLVSVAVAIDVDSRAVGNIQIDIQGIPVEEDREAFLEEACAAAAEALRKTEGDEAKLREAVRLAVRRRVTEWTGKKPVVTVLLVRV